MTVKGINIRPNNNNRTIHVLCPDIPHCHQATRFRHSEPIFGVYIDVRLNRCLKPNTLTIQLRFVFLECNVACKCGYREIYYYSNELFRIIR